MKSWPVLAVPISLVCLLGVWIAFSDSETQTEPVTADLEVPTQQNSQSEAANISASAEYDSMKHHTQASAPAARPDSKSQKPSEIISMDAQAPEADQGIPQASDLLEQAGQELHLEEGLSAFNLMVLKDLTSRLHELQADEAIWQNSMAEWPSELRDAFHRLSSALKAEAKLRTSWQENTSQNPDGFREALLKQQSQILGTELYAMLYAEDIMVVDEAGLSAHYASEEDAEKLVAKAHQNTLKLLEQWRQDKLSEADLTQALADSLSPEEIEQLIHTGLHETAWLAQLDQFLNEYRYIEQSGIIGEDEAQMRKELLEKHFSPENRGIVNQFLFGAQSAP